MTDGMLHGAALRGHCLNGPLMEITIYDINGKDSQWCEVYDYHNLYSYSIWRGNYYVDDNQNKILRDHNYVYDGDMLFFLSGARPSWLFKTPGRWVRPNELLPARWAFTEARSMLVDTSQVHLATSRDLLPQGAAGKLPEEH